MSGSLTWRDYEADNGTKYAVKRDESKMEATLNSATGNPLFAATLTSNTTLPSGVKMRYVNAQRVVNGEIQRARIFVGTKAAFESIVSSTTPVTILEATGITWQVTSTRGERSVRPSSVDTGLTDGDPT